jgi:hypothetical protein
LNSSEPLITAFVVHSSRDISLIRRIQGRLGEQRWIQLCVAEERRRPGTAVSEKIKELIETCQLVIVVWTPNTVKSPLANHEIGYAVARDRMIFPFVLSGTDPEGFLEGLEYVQFDASGDDEHIDELIETIRDWAHDLGYV